MTADIGVGAKSALVQTVVGTAANFNDVKQASAVTHGEEADMFADAGYQRFEKRQKIQAQHQDVNWHIAIMPDKRKVLDNNTPMNAVREKL